MPVTSPSNPERRSGIAAPGRGFTLSKRGLDIAVASACLLITAPLLLGCALWIKLVDGGPVVYSQWRVGHCGWLFRIYKLRTMGTDAEANGQARFASTNDPRILRGCGWMRKTHVDELPQLWNILAGQMSLVGPRPERPEIMDWLRESIPTIGRRLDAQPGLTGLAQVRNGYTNDLAGARLKVANDFRYLRSRSLLNEIVILFRTVPKVYDRASL